MASIPDDVVHDLARRYSADPADVRLLGGGEPSSDGIRYALRGPQPRILKIQIRQTADLSSRLAMEERLTTVDVLARRGVPVVTAMPSARGRLVETIDRGAATFAAYVTPQLPGVPLARQPRGARTRDLGELGRTLGTFHAASRRLSTWRSSAMLARGRPVLTWELEWEFFADWCRDRDVLHVWHDLRDRLAALPIEPGGFGFVHNDPHLGNAIVHSGRVTLVDLDVATYHWFGADLATAILAITQTARHDDALTRAQVATFLEHYLAEAPLGATWLAALPIHLAYRRVLLFIALYEEIPLATRERWRGAILADDPADRSTLPPVERLAG